MKVGLLGNMNNNFFCLLRYLREAGVDAHLLLLRHELGHFLPEHDTFSDQWEPYIHSLPWGPPYEIVNFSPNEIAASLAGYDFLIACGSAAAYLHKAKRIVNVFKPYGHDVLEDPFFRIVHPKNQLRRIIYSQHQRAGIRNAECVMAMLGNEVYESYLSRIKIRGRRSYHGIPLVYTPEFNPTSIQNHYLCSRWYPRFKSIRDAHDLVVFQHGRQLWKNCNDTYSAKGNDKLILGFADFTREHPDVKGCMVLFEYGIDVDASKELIQRMDLAERVFWLPQMSRKEIMIGISLADLVVGELNLSWFTYGVVFESLAMAKPLVHYRDDQLYEHLYLTSLYPMANAHSSQGIADILTQWAETPEHFRRIGVEGHAWMQRHLIDEVVAEVVDLIRASE